MRDSTSICFRGICGGLLFSTFLAIAIVLPGCKEDPTSSSDASVPSLNVGSSFTFETYDLDSTDTPIDGSTNSTTFTVGGAGATFRDRNGVTIFFQHGNDSGAFIYETNGDVTAWSEGHAPIHLGTDSMRSPSRWITAPYGGGSTAPDTVIRFDTTALVEGREVRFMVTEVMQYVGEEDLRIGSETLRTRKAIQRRYTTESTSSETYSDVYTWTQWYAPKLGFVAKSHGMRVDDQGRTDRWGMILTSYDLK